MKTFSLMMMAVLTMLFVESAALAEDAAQFHAWLQQKDEEMDTLNSGLLMMRCESVLPSYEENVSDFIDLWEKLRGPIGAKKLKALREALAPAFQSALACTRFCVGSQHDECAEVYKDLYSIGNHLASMQRQMGQ